jgi:hypothetical protein
MPLPYNLFQQMPRPKAPDQIQAEIYADKIAQNQVQRLPQQNRAQDLAIQGQEQGLVQTRRANAQKVAANYFSAIAQSQTPKQAAQAMLSNPNWASVAQELGLPADKFSVGPTDTDDAIRATAMDWARAMGGMPGEGGAYGLAPIYGEDAQGNPVVLQLNKGGGMARAQTPPGVRIDRGFERVDSGTHWTLIDKLTRQVVGTEPKNVAAAESEQNVGEWIGKQYGTIQEAGLSANQTLGKYDRLDMLARSIETGRLAGVQKSLNEVAQALGVDVAGLDETQAFQALTNQLALEMRNPSGGAGMPGAMSDADRNFLVRTVPNTPGGNRQIIEYARAVAKRNQDVARLARQYKSKHGSFDDAFLEELSTWSAANPMFPQTQTAPGGESREQYLERLRQEVEALEAQRAGQR